MQALWNHPYSVSDALWTTAGGGLFHIHSCDEITANIGESAEMKKPDWTVVVETRDHSDCAFIRWREDLGDSRAILGRPFSSLIDV